MAETMTPIILVADPIRAQARSQGFESVDPNPAVLAQMAETCENTVDTNRLALVLDRTQPKFFHRRREPVYFDAGLQQQVDFKKATEGREVMHLRLPPNRPIVQAKLSRLVCTNLFKPVRDRDFYRLGLPGMLSKGLGVAALMSAIAVGIVEREPHHATYGLSVVSAIALVTGFFLRREYNQRDRQYDMFEYGGAQLLDPIRLRPAANKPQA